MAATTLSVSNATSLTTQDLDASIAATASGTISLLGAGQTDTTDLKVGLVTTSPGAVSGTAVLSFSSVGTGSTTPSPLPSQTLTIDGVIYGLATGQITPPSNLIFHVGDAGTADLTLYNATPANGDYEGLRRTIISAKSISAAGTTGLIAAGGNDASSLNFSVSTAATGTQTGTIVVDLKSDGTGTDGAAPIDIGTLAVPVTAQIENYATLGLLATGGTFTGSGSIYTLNLGTVLEGSSALSVEYWHVELDQHDILLAEDLPCESYLDTGNRDAFDHETGPIRLHPHFAPLSWDNACAPLFQDGRLVVAEKQRLFDRSGATTPPPKPTLQVLCNDQVLRSRNLGRGMLSYAVPDSARDLVLASPAFIPAAHIRDSLDIRMLGVRLLQVRIDGNTLDMDAPVFGAGFYPTEESTEGPCRWTNGRATLALPANTRRVTLTVADRAAPRVDGTASRSAGQSPGRLVSMRNQVVGDYFTR